MDNIVQRIGTVYSPYSSPEKMPVEARKGGKGFIEVDHAFRAGLADLDGFERIWLIYHCHRSRSAKLVVQPFFDPKEKGVFATRAPARPSPIGLSSVRLLSVDVESGRLEVEELDVVDGTPLLDIKPYVPRFDSYPDVKAGWQDQVEHSTTVLSDERFARPED